jgi:ABC-type Mn2+/Zn2+ transport system permease subunit
MVAIVVSFVVGVVAGAVSTFLFLRKNAKIAAQANAVVHAVVPPAAK